ncbi:hypothetical protein RUM44_006979 [Polyplax serrata]|uniref:Uncharacterized protein n=1 Tax=Polyplax serrata TaxID=468196 RepID=A0ABR1AZW9_POLSC
MDGNKLRVIFFCCHVPAVADLAPGSGPYGREELLACENEHCITETVAELSCSTGWKAEGKIPLFSKYDRSKEADIIHIFAGWEALKIERTALTIRVERVVEENRSIDVKVQAKEFEVFED